MPANDVTVFAETNFRNQRRRFGIKLDDRRRHLYVVGKTGMGKSTLLENMVVVDIRAGHGVAVVDPHGDLAEKILDFIPNERVNDVIYFNPADTQYPIAFNILESVGPDYKHLVAYGLVGVFKKIWADSWGPRMEYIMTNTILALLDYPGSTLLGVMRMLVDKAYRKKVVAKVTDPVVKTFWADEFANYSEKFRTEAIAPIQNKVGQFLASSIIRNIVGQSKSTIEMRTIMDERKIIIMNLAKGRIGEENSALLGAMMITKLQIAAMSRVDVPEEDRKDFFLYVDEFQNFATDSFAGILSEARKYRLCLIMAHQYFEQLNDIVKAAVFGNVGTIIVFRVGATDAAELELEFAPQFTPTDIVNLKKYTFCMRLMVDGVATEPFSAIGLPPVTGFTSNRDKVTRVSRERYARPQNLVEERIIRWSGVEVARPNGSGATTEEIASADAMAMGEDDMMEDNVPAPPTPPRQPEAPAVPSPQSDYNDTNATVDLSKIIPGEEPMAPRLATTSVTQPRVALAAADELAPPVVKLPVEHFVKEAQARPKVNFVASPRSAVPEQPSVSRQPDQSTWPAVRPTVPMPTQMPKQSQVQTQPQQPQPRPEAIASISLKSLQTGTAPQVLFKDVNNRASQFNQPKPNQFQPAPQSVGQQMNVNDPNASQRRKRKRKRRSGGGGGGGGVDYPGSARPNPGNAAPSQPNQNQLPQQRRLEPQRPAAAPTPAASTSPIPAFDANKVSFKDLMN